MFNLGAFLSYVVIMTFTPGPNNIMAMAHANKFGFKRTLPFNLGVFTGFFLIMLLASYFNLILYNIMPRIKIIMGILGGLYMLYLAYRIMVSHPNTEHKEEIQEKPKRLLSLYLTGMVLQLVNPKAIIYGITVAANFIIPYFKSNMAIILFSLLLAFISILSTSSWALFGSIFNRLMNRYHRPLNIAMGILLIYSAISISGITSLF